MTDLALARAFARNHSQIKVSEIMREGGRYASILLDEVERLERVVEELDARIGSLNLKLEEEHGRAQAWLLQSAEPLFEPTFGGGRATDVVCEHVRSAVNRVHPHVVSTELLSFLLIEAGLNDAAEDDHIVSQPRQTPRDIATSAARRVHRTIHEALESAADDDVCPEWLCG